LREAPSPAADRPEEQNGPPARIEPAIAAEGSEALPPARRPGLGSLLAVALIAAIVSGAVATAVTLAIFRQQARTNPQELHLGSNVTIAEESVTRQVADRALPAVVSVVTHDRGTTYGSGFLVTSDGYLVTNTAVVANATSLSVILSGDSKRHDARLVDYDCRSGFAVLKVDQVSGLPTLPFGDSTALKPGQTVIALGGPLEQRAVVSRGVVTAVHKRASVAGPVASASTTTYADTIQTDAAIGRGGSGGPLLNVGGQVVGVSMLGSLAGDAVAFALAANTLQPGVQQILQSGRLQLPGLGAQVEDLGPEDVALRGLPLGSLVLHVERGGPADLAGIKAGDVITQLDATRVDAAHPLGLVLQTDFRPSQRIQVSYNRSNSSSQVQLNLQREHPTCA
jgi:S1-C subfamily serine protease